MRHNSIRTLKDKCPSLGKNTWQEKGVIYRKVYFKQMAQQTPLDMKMEIVFLNLYQWAYQNLRQKKYIHYIFLDHLILINKLSMSYNSAQLNENSFSLLSCTLLALYLFLLAPLVSLFLLESNHELGSNNCKKSDLLSKQARSHRADVKTQICLLTWMALTLETGCFDIFTQSYP